MHRIFSVFVSAFIFVGLNAWTLSGEAIAQQRGSKAAQVILETLDFEYETTLFEAVGTAEAIQSVMLYPAVSDRVVEINFAPEQIVSANDILLKLDDRRQQVAVQRANIQLADAKRNLERIKQSLQRGAVTQSALDEAITLRDLAQVQLNEAKVELEDRLVRAPFDGVVGLTDIEVGDRISTSTPITSIDNRESLFVNFNAPESALAVINGKPLVEIQPWADRTEVIDADIAEVDSRVNVQDRTIRIRAIFDNINDNYRPGMSFRVNLSLLGKRYASIPEASLSWGAAGAFIWIAENGKALKVPVEVKQRLRGRILVDGDINEGQQLIAEGIQRLRDGQKVENVQATVKRNVDSAQGARG